MAVLSHIRTALQKKQAPEKQFRHDRNGLSQYAPKTHEG